MKKVITVIVTYNRKQILYDSLNALNDCDGNNYILIVDNGCTDGTYEYISSFLNKEEKFGYYRIEKNIGATNGFNKGIRRAISLGCEYVWVMDDDCVVNRNSLSKLIDAANHLDNKFGFLSSRANWIDGNPCVMNVQKRAYTKKIKDFNKNYQKIILASFVSLFLKSDVVKELGLPISDFYIWTDDWEYTRRISKKYPCFYISDSIVTHKTNNNVGASIHNISNDRLFRCNYLFRNDYYLYRSDGLRGRIYFNLRVLYHKVKLILSKKSDKKERLMIIKNAIKEGKRFFPSVEYPFESYDNLNVLILFGEPFLYGGQEAYMINMYSNFDSKIRYTFATPFSFENTKLKEIIDKRGDKIISLKYSFNKFLRKNNIRRSCSKIFKEKYDVVHIQSSSCFALPFFAKKAKEYGVKKIIVHSHCGGVNTLRYKIAKKYADKQLPKYADLFLTCSFEAAIWKFPKKIIDSKNYLIVNNGIDVDKFKFDNKDRNEIRMQYNISDESLVLCHVGRFAPEKNHMFFLPLIKKLIDANKDFYFIFVGAGELKSGFIDNIKNFKCDERFIFLENIDYVNKIMSSSDIFLMPSLSEGFPMVLVESQTNGLFSIFSDSITEECIITDNSLRLPLNVEEWYYKVNNHTMNVDMRIKYCNIVREKGYDSKSCASLLEELYIK